MTRMRNSPHRSPSFGDKLVTTTKPKRIGIAARAKARRRRLELALMEDGMSLKEARNYLEADRLAEQAIEIRRRGLTAELVTEVDPIV
jgi:hypothetical protein